MKHSFKTILVFCTGLGSLVASSFLFAEQTTTVFKVINPDGSVSYSDQAQQNSEVLQISPITTVPAFILPSISSPEAATHQNNVSSNTYISMEISVPANNSAFYSGSGDVDIIAELIPPLRSGDQIEFKVDGSTVATKTANQHTLKTLDRGTHTIDINVISATGEVLKTASSTFTVHRPIKR